MSHIFVSGSSAGIGFMAAQLLAEQGHDVVIHARTAARGKDARQRLPKAKGLVVGDLETIAGTRDVANQLNALGRFDGVIHNAAVGYREGHRLTADGLPHVFAVNTLSPYVLTALMQRPKRLVYLSSGLHLHADANLDDMRWETRRWSGSAAYSESKLLDTMLAFAVARLWADVWSNAIEPGWVATKMGGAGAPDDLTQAHLTQVWLAAGDDPKANVTGEYFYHMNRKQPNPQARDAAFQERFISLCAKISGVELPR